MVDITPLLKKGSQIIHSYGSGGFVVGDKSFKGSMLIIPNGVYSWNVTDINNLKISDFSELIDEKQDIEILLLGTGVKMQFVDDEIIKQLKRNKIVVDMMDSGAACRTYNVLLSEERKVAAAIIAI